jgi:hypothetical protein
VRHSHSDNDSDSDTDSIFPGSASDGTSSKIDLVRAVLTPGWSFVCRAGAPTQPKYQSRRTAMVSFKQQQQRCLSQSGGEAFHIAAAERLGKGLVRISSGSFSHTERRQNPSHSSINSALHMAAAPFTQQRHLPHSSSGSTKYSVGRSVSNSSLDSEGGGGNDGRGFYAAVAA